MLRAVLIIIAAWFILAPQDARAEFGDCNSADYLSEFDDRLGPQDCVVVVTTEIRWRGGSAQMRAIRPASMTMTDSPRFAARIRETAAGVGAAMDRMGGGMSINDVTVVFTDMFSQPETGIPEGQYIAAAGKIFDDECAATYYKNRKPVGTGDNFVFNLSHELFHCITDKTWPTFLDADWLTEGTAEYFAHLAKPGHPAEWTPAFNEEIKTKPLDQMDYAAQVFFIWLGQTRGPQAVRDFIPSVRRNIGSVVDSDMWIEFGKAYFDKSIQMPDGRNMPSTPAVTGFRTFTGDDDISPQTFQPFTLNQHLYTFARNKVFNLAHTTRGIDTRIAWRPEAGTEWTEPLNKVLTCDGEKTYRAIHGSTRTSNFGSFTVRIEPASRGACVCPTGIWTETDASVRRYFQQSGLGIYAGSSRNIYISGGRTLTLNEDHTGSFIYNSVITETRSSDDSWLRQTKTGGSHFTWKVENGILYTFLSSGSDNLITMNNETHSPQGVRHSVRKAGAQSIGHLFSCDPAGLHLRESGRPAGLVSSFNVNLDFNRAGVAPSPTR